MQADAHLRLLPIQSSVSLKILLSVLVRQVDGIR